MAKPPKKVEDESLLGFLTVLPSVLARAAKQRAKQAAEQATKKGVKPIKKTSLKAKSVD